MKFLSHLAEFLPEQMSVSRQNILPDMAHYVVQRVAAEVENIRQNSIRK
jgi:hypothetical protein